MTGDREAAGEIFDMFLGTKEEEKPTRDDLVLDQLIKINENLDKLIKLQTK